MINPVVRSVSNAQDNPAAAKHIRRNFASPAARRHARESPRYAVPVSALRAALVALSAAVLTAACAAGQQAQTAREKPTIDGTRGHGRLDQARRRLAARADRHVVRGRRRRADDGVHREQRRTAPTRSPTSPAPTSPAGGRWSARLVDRRRRHRQLRPEPRRARRTERRVAADRRGQRGGSRH